MPIKGSKAPVVEGEWLQGGKDLRSGDVLLDFWSFSCRDCLEKLERLEKLHGNGLDVVAVHTPDFEFEKSFERLERLLEEKNLSFHVVHDSEGATRRKYGSKGPVTVLINDGEVVWQNNPSTDTDRFLEKLSERSGKDPDWIEHRSFEKYLGSRRCDGINNKGNFRGTEKLEAPKNRKLNHVYLDGEWRQQKDFIEAVENAKLYFYADTSEFSIVASSKNMKDIEVRIDHEVPESRLLREGGLRVDDPGLYRIASVDKGKHEIELRPEKGVKLYSIVSR